jgi:hypothetical protein
MQDSKLMSATGAATAKVMGLDEIASFRLIPPLPYTSTLIPAEKLRETIFQIARERQAKEREAALNGNAEPTGLR